MTAQSVHPATSRSVNSGCNFTKNPAQLFQKENIWNRPYVCGIIPIIEYTTTEYRGRRNPIADSIDADNRLKYNDCPNSDVTM